MKCRAWSREKYLLVLGVRGLSLRAEMGMSHRGAGHFVELSDSEDKEAWEVISERGLPAFE